MVQILTAGGMKYQGNPYQILPSKLQQVLKQRAQFLSEVSMQEVGIFWSYVDSNLWAYHDFYRYFERTRFRWGNAKTFSLTPTNSLVSLLAMEMGIQGMSWQVYEPHFCFNGLEMAQLFLTQNRLKVALFGWEGPAHPEEVMAGWQDFAEGKGFVAPEERIAVYGLLTNLSQLGGSRLQIQSRGGTVLERAELNRQRFFDYTGAEAQVVIYR